MGNLYIYQKTMLMLNVLFTKILMKKIKILLLFKCMKSWRFKCIFYSITWYFGFKCFIDVYIVKNSLKMKIYLFSFGQNMKKIIMVKVGYFCMGQRMMWNNVVNLSHICRNPTFGRVWWWHSHSPKWGLGSPPGLPELQSLIAGVKHLALRCSSYHWKAIEV